MATVEKQKIFIANSPEVNMQTIANYLPGGEYFRGKNIDGSNLRRLLKSFSYEFTRLEAKIQELIEEYYIENTYNLIEDWEETVGIPDECFGIKNQTIETRRKQVIAKLALMNLTTTIDFVELASYFGVRVTIDNGFDIGSTFPMTLPAVLAESRVTARFTMVVTFPDLEKPKHTFPFTFPFTFEEDPPLFIICLFEKLKPINVKIVVKFKEDLPEIGYLLLQDGGKLLWQSEGKIQLQ